MLVASWAMKRRPGPAAIPEVGTAL
jgi:hypothetical protein